MSCNVERILIMGGIYFTLLLTEMFLSRIDRLLTSLARKRAQQFVNHRMTDV